MTLTLRVPQRECSSPEVAAARLKVAGSRLVRSALAAMVARPCSLWRRSNPWNGGF